jgi:hypothetical protein
MLVSATASGNGVEHDMANGDTSTAATAGMGACARGDMSPFADLSPGSRTLQDDTNHDGYVVVQRVRADTDG